MPLEISEIIEIPAFLRRVDREASRPLQTRLLLDVKAHLVEKPIGGPQAFEALDALARTSAAIIGAIEPIDHSVRSFFDRSLQDALERGSR